MIDVLATISMLLFIFFFPALTLFLEKKNKVFNTIGAVVMCYAVGAIINMVFHLDFNFENPQKITDHIVKNAQILPVLLAIPLLLLSTNFIKWLKQAPLAAKSFLLSMISVITLGVLCYFLFLGSFSSQQETAWVSAMMMGVYTGGTPNLSSIGLALGAPNELFLTINAADVIIGGSYFLLLLTVVKPLLNKFLRPFKSNKSSKEKVEEEQGKYFWKNITISKWLLAIFIAIICVCLGLALAEIFPSVNLTGKLDTNVALLFIVLTSAAIGFSFIKSVREIKGTFETGNYLILIFCTALGLTVDIPKMFSSGGVILLYLATMMLGSIILHFILCKIFKVDVDTAIITSTASIYGAPFIIPVADAIKNPEVIVSGLATSMVGYAVGNYLGIIMGKILL